MRSWLSDDSKRRALASLVSYAPTLASAIVAFSLLTALLEGVGIGFLLPILASGSEVDVSGDGGSQLLRFFESAYAFLGVPFSLETLLLGVAMVMTVRHVASVGVSWLQAILAGRYVAELRRELLDGILTARVAYLDDSHSSSLVNAVVTETTYGSMLVANVVNLLNGVLLGVAYLGISLWVAPRLTVVAVGTLGAVAVLVRLVLEPAYAAGDRLRTANDAIQRWAQAGIFGTRTVKAFDLYDHVNDRFESAVLDYKHARIDLTRNQSVLSNGYMLASALVVFGVIYLALEVSALSLGTTAVLLFAMFRLAPTAKRVSDSVYSIDGHLPHLVTVRERLAELDAECEPEGGTASPPDSVEEVALEDVSFAYDDGTEVLDDTSMTLRRGELTALVGPSGRGKSTVVSLLCRFYDPDDGAVTADGTPISSFDLREWRSRVALVRQDPFLFDDTLRANVTFGNLSASQAEFERACKQARVDEFADDLAEGYDTRLGDDGVRLSGGQRQRVAIARALLDDADVLIFDEATSDLDPSLDDDLSATIESLSEDAVTLVVAHRRSTTSNADRIYALEDGSVTAKEAGDLHPAERS